MSSRSFIAQQFEGTYYTDRENKWIDTVRLRIGKLKCYRGERDYKAAMAYYSLFQSCLAKRPFNLFHRANLYIRQSAVERSFGNKTTWDTPFRIHFKKFSRELNKAVFKGARPCRATNFYVEDIPDEHFDLIYLDPPYVKKLRNNETANYLRCYHFLEGLARYDEWPRLIDGSKKTFEISFERHNPWVDPRSNIRAFEETFRPIPAQYLRNLVQEVWEPVYRNDYPAAEVAGQESPHSFTRV